MASFSVAFIGVGNMSGAMIYAFLNGLSDSACKKKAIGCLYLCDISAKALDPFRSNDNVSIVKSSRDAAAKADIVFLCVKPWQLTDAVADMGDALDGKAVVSIAAGWTTDALKALMPSCRIMRVMPNTPALVGKGVMAVSDANSFTDNESNAVHDLLAYSGMVEYVTDEQMDAVTAVSGGGPAYVSLFIEALADAAVREGLPRETARRVAAQTVLGSAMLALSSAHTAVLRDAVLTPSGTTIEAIAHLERTAVRGSIIDAVHCAAERSRQLAKGD